MAVGSIQIASDIHLEMFTDYSQVPLTTPSSPILALLGDIGYPKSKIFLKYITEMCSRFRYVLMLAGNHEYYGECMVEVEERLREFEKQFKNFKFLQRDSIELTEVLPGYRIIGCTLWVNFPEVDHFCAPFCISDYKQISILDSATETVRKLSVDDTQKLHVSHAKFIQNEIETSEKPLIILTHHAPTAYKCLGPESLKQNDIRYRMNFTHFEKYMTSKCAAWCFGHTHCNTDVIIHSVEDDVYTRIVTNQQGYIPSTGMSKGYQVEKKITFPVNPSESPEVEILSSFRHLITSSPP